MPKMKTKSSAKKRFSLTASGKVKAKHSKKRHNMRKRTQQQIVDLRKGKILKECDAKFVKKHMMPNDL